MTGSGNRTPGDGYAMLRSQLVLNMDEGRVQEG